MRPYRPLIRNPHLNTIASNFWPRTLDTERFPVRSVRYKPEPDVEILVKHQEPKGVQKGHLVLVHGLEGSSEGGYMRSLAQAALLAGYSVHRTNIRGCGGTEGLCNTLYHAGLTTDVLHVLEQFQGWGHDPVYLIGFSLGGNVVLKLAGELGERAKGLLRGVVSVCTPIDLAHCVRKLGDKSNFIYQWRFVRSMKRRMRERNRLMPERFSLAGVDEIRTIYHIDDKITAPHFGFGNADNYYATQSAIYFLQHIAVPTLVIASKDDPLVPFEMYRHEVFSKNPNLELMAPEHGGHVSFLAKGDDRFWLDGTILDWVGRRE